MQLRKKGQGGVPLNQWRGTRLGKSEWPGGTLSL